MAEHVRIPSVSEIYLLLLLAKNSRNPELASKVVISIQTIDFNTGCWFKSENWSEYTTIDKIGAHRVSYRAFINELKFNHEICHHCDRKGCFNPYHLFQGTHSENIQDAINKGRILHIKIEPSKHKYNSTAILEAKKIIHEVNIHHGELFGSIDELDQALEKYEKGE